MANSRECSCSTPAVMIPLVLLAALYNSHQLTSRAHTHIHTHTLARTQPCFSFTQHLQQQSFIFKIQLISQGIAASIETPSQILTAYAVKPENNFITTF